MQRLCDRAACMEQGHVVKVGARTRSGMFYHGLLGIPVEDEHGHRDGRRLQGTVIARW
ncbi:MAG: hypothetical protein IPO79_11715 [Flavobacteriales bacterium]|nr:hypothetical protein [Flavobacteriales bacterium]